MQTGNAIVALDLFFAFGTFARGVALHPVMQHLLRCPG